MRKLIFALLLVAATGHGAFPGIPALACRTVGFMSKTTAEAFEIVDWGPFEAMEATGASPLSVFLFVN